MQLKFNISLKAAAEESSLWKVTQTDLDAQNTWGICKITDKINKGIFKNECFPTS